MSVSYKKHSTKQNNDINKVLIVDCESFDQASRRNYKLINFTDAIPEQPELKFSRYEVLNKPVRRVYFDFDGIPDVPENYDLPDRFVAAWIEFMKGSNGNNSVMTEERNEYVKTTNHASQVHSGFSSHIIMYNYKMHINDLKKSVIMLTNSPQGQEFADYVDTVVYSSMRLFKLVNFIGIPMTDLNNYHRMDPKDSNFEHYIIQRTENTQHLYYTAKVPLSIRRSVKQISQPQTGQLTKEISDAILTLKNIFVERQPMYYNEDEQTKQLNALLTCDKVSEFTKNKLRKYIPVKPENKPTIASLISLIKNKYKITDNMMKELIDKLDVSHPPPTNDDNNDNADDENIN